MRYRAGWGRILRPFFWAGFAPADLANARQGDAFKPIMLLLTPNEPVRPIQI
jgi:hypothetical protein